jgi:hypothetical protein
MRPGGAGPKKQPRDGGRKERVPKILPGRRTDKEIFRRHGRNIPAAGENRKFVPSEPYPRRREPQMNTDGRGFNSTGKQFQESKLLGGRCRVGLFHFIEGPPATPAWSLDIF